MGREEHELRAWVRRVVNGEASRRHFLRTLWISGIWRIGTARHNAGHLAVLPSPHPSSQVERQILDPATYNRSSKGARSAQAPRPAWLTDCAPVAYSLSRRRWRVQTGDKSRVLGTGQASLHDGQHCRDIATHQRCRVEP